MILSGKLKGKAARRVITQEQKATVRSLPVQEVSNALVIHTVLHCTASPAH